MDRFSRKFNETRRHPYREYARNAKASEKLHGQGDSSILKLTSERERKKYMVLMGINVQF